MTVRGVPRGPGPAPAGRPRPACRPAAPASPSRESGAAPSALWSGGAPGREARGRFEGGFRGSGVPGPPDVSHGAPDAANSAPFLSACDPRSDSARVQCEGQEGGVKRGAPGRGGCCCCCCCGGWIVSCRVSSSPRLPGRQCAGLGPLDGKSSPGAAPEPHLGGEVARLGLGRRRDCSAPPVTSPRPRATPSAWARHGHGVPARRVFAGGGEEAEASRGPGGPDPRHPGPRLRLHPATCPVPGAGGGGGGGDRPRGGGAGAAGGDGGGARGRARAGGAADGHGGVRGGAGGGGRGGGRRAAVRGRLRDPGRGAGRDQRAPRRRQHAGLLRRNLRPRLRGSAGRHAAGAGRRVLRPGVGHRQGGVAGGPADGGGPQRRPGAVGEPAQVRPGGPGAPAGTGGEPRGGGGAGPVRV